MDKKRLTRRSFLKSLVLFVCAVVLTVHTPFVTANPAAVPAAEHITRLNAGMTSAGVVAALPRNETMYFNGQQWNPVLCWNPYSSNCNNFMAIAPGDNARVTVWETPYVYNMLTGEQFPLLADGPYTWNPARTEITFKIKAAAKWRDGTRVTAEDVAYTWFANVTYGTGVGDSYKDFIDSIEAVDPATVLVKAKLDGGKAVNPLLVESYLSTNYVIQKAWTQTVEARTGGDAEAFKADYAWDFVSSGPYYNSMNNDQIVVLVRDDNYWGQDATMWGRLPTPKYLAHVIYADNAAGNAAFIAGEVDVSQQFIANVQDLWLVDGLPVSTYLPEAPYGIGASLPTAFYNLHAYGLDNVVIRKAIAIAIDYDTIIANAMSNQSATFEQVPRSIMNPTPAEQALYDHAAVADLQWAGNDIAGANAMLDAAGITDTNADGWREYNGTTLHYVATCPNGWSDWQAAIEIVAAAGPAIGIQITTNYPEWGVYQTIVTRSDAPLPAGYDIFMMWSAGAGPTAPWSRVRGLISSEWVGMASNWNGNWGGYVNPAADALIQAIPTLTDTATLKAYYTALTEIYLTDIPSFTLMYRPQAFHTVNGSFWMGFPHQGDGANPPVPPLDMTDGYGIAGLYNVAVGGIAVLPRDQTMYFNGQQWYPVNCWNPYSSNCNNAMAISPGDNARVAVWETPYVYNMLTGEQVPLLADGPYTWNPARTEITFKIKAAAKWRDGAPVTAEDVAYTWFANVTYGTGVGDSYKDFIDSIEAVDPATVLVKAKLDGGKAVNPLLVESYLSSNYVIQKAWTQTLEARTGGDADAFKGDYAWDSISSGPYYNYFNNGQIVILIRDDNYWGQDASMWGKLPTPKYLAHVIYADNAAGNAAFIAGEVDVSQQFIANVQDLWLVDGLPVSTYLPEAPYGIGASLPTAFYNLHAYGLDNVVIRKAIAIAIDYDTIIANAMSNQSATFKQVPRSIMNPTPAEQAMYDHAAVEDLQWAGNDIAGANAMLDAAGIVDTNADGWREYNGTTLHYVATCPNGWSDWQAAIEIVAAAGPAIGIDITTNYPDWSVYQTVVTRSDAPLPAGYDIFMMWSAGAGPTAPWSRVRGLISSEWVGMASNWNGNWGGYVNPAADALIQAIPTLTDTATLKAYYTALTEIYLTDIPSFTLMYRPQSFHAVNESIWKGFPHQGDGANPPVPPLDMTDGYGIAGLYNVKLAAPYHLFLPLLKR